MKQRVLSVLLVVMMVTGLFSGCAKTKTKKDEDSATSGTQTATTESSTTEGATAEDKEEEPKEIEKIKIFVPTQGKSDDMAKVMDAVNAISREKIGVEVE